MEKPLALLALLLISRVLKAEATLPSSVRIGSLFIDTEHDVHEGFRRGIESLQDRGFLNGTEVITDVQAVTAGDSFRLYHTACAQLTTGISTLFGPSDPFLNKQLLSMTNKLGIPLISTAPRPCKETSSSAYTNTPPSALASTLVSSSGSSSSEILLDSASSSSSDPVDLSVSLYPTQSQLINLITSVAKELGWKDMSIIHDADTGIIDPTSLAESLQLLGRVSVHQKGADLRSRLIKLRLRGARNIIVDTSIENVPNVIQAALETGMMTSSYSYIFTMLDMKAGDWSRLAFSEALILGFNIIDEARFASWKSKYGQVAPPTSESSVNVSQQVQPNLKPSLGVALALDAAELLARGIEYFEEFGTDFSTPEITTCSGDKKWETGQTLKEAYSSATFEGITGPISFSHGERSRLEAQLLKLKYQTNGESPDLVAVGNWTTGNFEVDEGLTIFDSLTLSSEEPQQALNKTLIVTTLPGTSCVSKSSKDGDKFEGFCVDVLEEIAKVAGFQYKLRPAMDSRYGVKDSVSGAWNGMIGEVMRGEADVAMADLTVTAAREDAVDFAAPFMHTSLGVLYKNFEASGQELSTLLSPFSLWVWISIVLAFFVTSVCLRIVAWLSPFQKEDIILPGTPEHHPSLGQDLTWLNSMWLLASTLVLRGSDVRIQAVSSRTVTVVWWLFSLLTLIIYASLVSHWFDPGSMPQAYSVETLIQRNPTLEIGVVSGGASQRFLENSERDDLRKVWWQIQKTPEARAFPPTTETGIDAVKRGGGKYAFVGEDRAFRDALSTDCSLNLVTGLDTRSFAPAVAKGSDLRDKITKAVLTLRENGKLHQLESKWWSPRSCVDMGGRPQVQMMNFIGPLTLLVFGMVVALLVAMVERIFYHRRSHRGFFRTSNGENGNGKIAINQIDTDSS